MNSIQISQAFREKYGLATYTDKKTSKSYKYSELIDNTIIPDDCVHFELDTITLSTSKKMHYPENIIIPQSVRHFAIEYDILTKNIIPELPDSLIEFESHSNKHQKFTNIPTNLKVLICVNSKLTSLPTLNNNLVILNVSSNRLSDMNIYLPESLRILIYNGNNVYNHSHKYSDNIIELDASYQYIKNQGIIRLRSFPLNINYVNFNKCALSKIPDILPNNIVELSIANNTILTLPCLPDGIKKVYCQFNKLSELPAYIPDSLTYIDFADNIITELPDFPLNDNLQCVNCSFNPIKYLNPHNYAVFRRIYIKSLLYSNYGEYCSRIHKMCEKYDVKYYVTHSNLNIINCSINMYGTIFYNNSDVENIANSIDTSKYDMYECISKSAFFDLL